MAKRRKKYKNQDDLIIGCYGIYCARKIVENLKI